MAITKDELRRDLGLLEQAVNEAPEEPTVLAELRAVLLRASEAIRAVQADVGSGAYVVPLSPDRMRTYFPVTEWPPREPTSDAIREADARWAAALYRGRRHRQQALEQLGPVLTPRQVAERLGVSTVTVNNWRRRGKLLAIRFDDHQYLYPLFQFAESPSQGEQGVLRHFEQILNLLPTVSSWTKAKFFLAKAPFLGGRTPLDLLRSGKPVDFERVRLLAPHLGEMGS
jgi:hypothetical protein